jgi:glycosyltransferase 2 family protein
VGLLVLLFRAGALEQPFRRLFLRLPQGPKLAKIEHWILLALDALRKIGALGSLALLLQSFLVWSCDGVIFISMARLVNLKADLTGLWQTESVANLSYLIPSSPGAIGPFEAAAKTTLVSHGSNASQAALFGLAVHVWLLVTVTGAGGWIFLVHRYHMRGRRPLGQELETLPVELP